jgi:hypothetical protein
MPHLHLPADHTEADLVLAANLAEVVGSEELYVAWSHESGSGAVPEVAAVVREQRPSSPLGEVVAALAAFWRGLMARPEAGEPRDQGAGDRRGREAERPYAD